MRQRLAFAAPVDARRPRRIVGGDLAQQLDLPGRPERRRIRARYQGIVQRDDFGLDHRQKGRHVEVERMTERPGETRFNPSALSRSTTKWCASGPPSIRSASATRPGSNGESSG
jgi:hypothetical protein